MRLLIAIALALLPNALRRRAANLVPGWEVDSGAYFGRSLVMVRKLSMAPGSSIGPFNVIKGLDQLTMQEGAAIAERNRITAVPSASGVFTHSPKRRPALLMGPYSMITNAHEIDCSDTVELADHAIIAGFRSQVLTHSLNLVQDRFTASPVRFGSHSALMSGCIVLSGMQVPANSIISAGSVITTRLTAEHTFYRGNPAEPVRDLPPTLGFFSRQGLQPQVAAEVEALTQLRKQRSVRPRQAAEPQTTGAKR